VDNVLAGVAARLRSDRYQLPHRVHPAPLSRLDLKMANVNVTYQQMEDAAGRLLNGRTEIDGMLGQLQNLVNQLVADGYVTDSSSKTFQASYEEFTQGAKRMIEGLDGMGQYLNQAAATFRDADTQLAGALGR
jgi:WXG100 family type VII secretion target